jgi:hypothetical protein
VGGQAWKSDTGHETLGEKQTELKLNDKKYPLTILTTNV